LGFIRIPPPHATHNIIYILMLIIIKILMLKGKNNWK